MSNLSKNPFSALFQSVEEAQVYSSSALSTETQSSGKQSEEFEDLDDSKLDTDSKKSESIKQSDDESKNICCSFLSVM